MKVTYIGHAALLAEINGVNVLSDPWLVGPCFGVQWWQWPRPRAEVLKDIDVNFIYISHGHNDHLHSGTLQRLDKSAKVLVSRNSSIAEAIEHMGFETIVLKSETPVEIAPGISAEIIDTLNPDSMLVLSDGKEVLVNANDALLPVPEALRKRIIDHLRRRYGKIDYAFIGYGIASGFPNSHFVPGKNNAKSAEKRQRHFNGVWSSLMAGINPKYGLPFAADVVLLDENLIWANEPVRNRERPTDRFRLDHPESSTQVVDIAPGFTVIDGRITKEVVFEPVHLETLRAEMAAEIRKANEARAASVPQVQELAALIEHNVQLCQAYLTEFEHDYNILIRLKNAAAAIVLTKTGDRFNVAIRQEPADTEAYDLVFTTRFSYLRRALQTQWGYEVITVGSGGTWQYGTRQAAATNMYQELAAILRKRDVAPPSRYGDQPRWLYEVKSRIKRGLGKQNDTLYDLLTWTVFDDEVAPGHRAADANRAIGRR